MMKGAKDRWLKWIAVWQTKSNGTAQIDATIKLCEGLNMLLRSLDADAARALVSPIIIMLRRAARASPDIYCPLLATALTYYFYTFEQSGQLKNKPYEAAFELRNEAKSIKLTLGLKASDSIETRLPLERSLASEGLLVLRAQYLSIPTPDTFGALVSGCRNSILEERVQSRWFAEVVILARTHPEWRLPHWDATQLGAAVLPLALYSLASTLNSFCTRNEAYATHKEILGFWKTTDLECTPKDFETLRDTVLECGELFRDHFGWDLNGHRGCAEAERVERDIEKVGPKLGRTWNGIDMFGEVLPAIRLGDILLDALRGNNEY